jgi:hypothetical protein
MGFMAKLEETAALGAVPKMMGLEGKNAGFALGVVPGLLYKNKYDKDAEEAASPAPQAAEQAKGASATMKKGGSVSSASKRADGIAQRGKTRGKMY